MTPSKNVHFNPLSSSRHTRDMARDVTWIAGSVVMACALFAGLAAADPAPVPNAPMDKKSLIVALTDPELSVMRGKFLPNNQQVVFFGVQMVSLWQTAGGTMSAGMALGIDRGQGGTPTVSYQPTVTIMGTPMQRATHGIVLDGSAQDTRGVRQQIQVAGNDNQATNQFQVAVTPYATDGGGFSSGRGGHQHLSLSRGDATVTAGIAGSNQAGVTIQLGDSSVRQAIGGGANAVQMIQLAGDQQRIQNQLRLVVGVNQATGLSGVDLKHQVGMALASLRGM